MKLEVSRALDAKELYATAPKKADYDRTVVAPFELHDELGIQAYAEELEDKEEISKLWDSLSAIKYGTSTRTSGLVSTSRIVGFQPRIPVRRDFCCRASSASEHPVEHQHVLTWASKCEEVYKRVNPEKYAFHRELVRAKVAPCWRIEDSVFTSGIINKNNPLRYHRDKGNFDECWAAMVVLPQDLVGGDLVIPALRTRIQFPKPMLIVFNNTEFFHGVTRIQHGDRYSLVFYSLRDLGNCLSPEEELKRIRKVKTEREHKRTKKHDS